MPCSCFLFGNARGRRQLFPCHRNSSLRLSAIARQFGLVAGQGNAPGAHPILKLALTENTALTIAKAMKPTKMKTPMSTADARIRVNAFS